MEKENKEENLKNTKMKKIKATKNDKRGYDNLLNYFFGFMMVFFIFMFFLDKTIFIKYLFDRTISIFSINIPIWILFFGCLFVMILQIIIDKKWEFKDSYAIIGISILAVGLLIKPQLPIKLPLILIAMIIFLIGVFRKAFRESISSKKECKKIQKDNKVK